VSPAGGSAGARLATKLAAAASANQGDEANFRAKAEAALEAAARAQGIELDTRLEVTLVRGRADAVFNRYVVEWEPPGALSLTPETPSNRHAVGQVERYLRELAEREHHDLDRLAGVACDGHILIFARFRADVFLVDDPVPVDDVSAAELLAGVLAAHGGRALTAAQLLREFGRDTLIARRLCSALLDQLDEELGTRSSGPAALLYRQWEEYFAVATGVLGDAQRLPADAREALRRVVGVTGTLDPARALFVLQTYFAIVTKLIASLALALYVDRVEWSLADLVTAGDNELAEDVRHLENGGLFRKAGLLNVIEPDVFSWYVDWKPDVRDQVRELVVQLQHYDPRTLFVSPEDARDLLKDLYQGLLPRPLRHALGQYFTPDWLAEYTFERADVGDSARLVDPACGTGTFLVHAINQRTGRSGVDRKRLEHVIASVVGFDIDPLAAVAARTNYVLALGPLITAASERRPVEIPVYLADSIVMPALGETLTTGDRLRLATAAGVFELPVEIDSADRLRRVCETAAAVLDEGVVVTHSSIRREAAAACRHPLAPASRPFMTPAQSTLSRSFRGSGRA
jgi:hypothetical protein